MDVSVDGIRVIYHREGLKGILPFHIFPVMEMFMKFQVLKMRANDSVIRPIGLQDYSILASGQTFSLEHFLEQLFYNWKMHAKMKITRFGLKSYSIPMLPLYAGKDYLVENRCLKWYYDRYLRAKSLILGTPVQTGTALAPLTGTVYAVDDRSVDSDDNALPPNDLFTDYGSLNLDGGMYDAAADGPIIGTLPLKPAESIGSVISSETQRPLTPLTMAELREQVMKDPLLQPTHTEEEEERYRATLYSRNIFDSYLSEVLENDPKWLEVIQKIARTGDYTPEFNLLLASVPIPLDASGRTVTQDELRKVSEYHRKEYLRLMELRAGTRDCSLFSDEDKAAGYRSVIHSTNASPKRSSSSSTTAVPMTSHISRFDASIGQRVQTLMRRRQKQLPEMIGMTELKKDTSNVNDGSTS